MDKVLILNGSPRAPRSNSKEYGKWFAQVCPSETETHAITRDNHLELCRAAEHCSDLLLVFPLYVDGLPVTLLNFLKTLEKNPPQHKPTVSVLINCGFLEPEQNEVAVSMVELFCAENGYPFGSVLRIGGGEAILNTPFRGLVGRKLKQLAASMARGRGRRLKVTMPLPKKLFLRASTAYWENYGKRNGITKAQMETMDIEV